MRISSVDCMRIVRNMLLNKRVLLILAKIDGKSSGNNRGMLRKGIGRDSLCGLMREMLIE